MADLGKSDATWLRFDRELGLAVNLYRFWEELERTCYRERVQFRVLGDAVDSANIDVPHSANSLTGADPGVNLTEDGKVYVRITGGPTFTVSLYTATGASGLVAQGTATASATATLTAQNSSGLTGAIRLTAGVATTTADEIQLDVFPDWKLLANLKWPQDGTTDDDAASKAAWLRLLNRLRARARAGKADIVQFMREFANTASDNPVPRGADFLEKQDTSLRTERINIDSDGAVTRPVTGFFNTMLQAMADEKKFPVEEVHDADPSNEP